MTKQKPVWRMNMGRCVPSDLGGQLLYKGKRVQVPVYRSIGHLLWRLDMRLPIASYQTTRTKAAKFERAECNACKGCGNELEYDGETGGLYPVNLMCLNCNGTGRMARRITC